MLHFCVNDISTFTHFFLFFKEQIHTRYLRLICFLIFVVPCKYKSCHNSSITDCTDAQASPSLGYPVQASSPFRKISNKGTGNIARKTISIQETLTQELREPSSSNDSDNDQSSPNTSLPHMCNSNQLRVCIVNFCSLVSYNKHLELYQLIETHKPHIILGTETHRKKDIDSREIFPPNCVYSPPVRKDRNRVVSLVLLVIR